MFSPAVKIVANNLKLILSALCSGISASHAKLGKDCLVRSKQPGQRVKYSKKQKPNNDKWKTWLASLSDWK